MEASDSEQDRILAEAKQAIKRAAYSMRKAMEEDNMREALRFSAAMLSELRTSQLTPQKYYELYMLVFDQLVNLETFFGDEHAKGRTYAQLYELVQHAGNVLPRLYLMVAVGCLYIRAGEAGARDVLADLVELCKGVQHPTRGLFLRAYLSQRSRGLLPDTGSPYEGPAGGNVNDALHFLLSNFVEMNKLWVRMQHQGSVRDREKRERERGQLADLVGKNLTYVSQLDGLGYELYAGQVLPRVLEQIITCKDDIAQQYLFQAVIQVFPDAFHLGTLSALLDALPQLQPGVKVHAVLGSLMDRLAKYAGADAGALARLTSMAAFDRFRAAIAAVLAAQPGVGSAEGVEMYVALMNFSAAVHPNNVDHVNQVLAAAHTALSSRGGLGGDVRAEKALVALLSLPITRYDVVTGLGLSEYPRLMSLLRPRTHKDLATRIVCSVLDSGTRVSSVERVTMLFKFIRPLVHDVAGEGERGEGARGGEAPPTVDDMDDEDVASEQVLVARLLHALHSDDVATHFALLDTARAQLLLGGPRRLRHTLPALGWAGLALVKRLGAGGQGSSSGEVTPTSLVQWLLATGLHLGDAREPLSALRLLLAVGVAASEDAGQEELARDAFEQAFTLYEEGVAEQRARVTGLHSIVGSLHATHVFGPDNWATLVHNAAGYASRLLKRADQVRALCACARLSWQDEAAGDRAGKPGVHVARDAEQVAAMLQRALKAAQAAKRQAEAAARALPYVPPAAPGVPAGASAVGASYVTCFVEVLNHHLTYLELGVDTITPAVVQGVLDEVAGEVVAGRKEGGATDAEALRYWHATLRHVRSRARAGEGDSAHAARFAALQVPPAAADLH
mmetsp:Transcript_27157/g.69109  ORF Transcript_27157/g.69109 Transcript_27157/m.69109 type:complete len:847 (-) Transcript_27157:307-2847(-)|eukprot:CAMPEP_0202857628 /NCGR_PEP_ID=MMETSP1391-20130828/495_1 /ASSEMBLY_ACC=CAM_ASM_000867 /TAXON_ID=1034604 /ORGANISM="Chlamydomonas leiostraca, Strain SAG 11-49" /LENGTH=846 /DNA_ID=CAMNT_0049536449 /DNA_START=85 /DNA_END=2625 /DNA_ORIENTATION=-